MDLSVTIPLFILGVVIGSFLNVITLRYKPGAPLLHTKIIGGRSKCQGCKATLKWYELVPLLSFFAQGLKCRHCSHLLSWQYPTVEFITGLLTVSVPLFLYQFFNINALVVMGESVVWFYVFTLVWLLITYTFIVIAVIDLRHKIIPDQANILLAILGIGLLFIKDAYSTHFHYNGSFFKSYASVFAGQEGILVNTVYAVLVALVVYGGIILLTKGRGMGLGDLKLAVPIALIIGWPDVLIAFAASFIIGSLFAVPLLVHKIKKMTDGIPFGPFIILGVYIAMFYGYAISSWYFSLI